MQGFHLLRKYVPLIAGAILLVSSCLIVTPPTGSPESGSFILTQGADLVTVVSTSSSSTMRSSFFSDTITVSGLSYSEFASNSQPYYAASSLPPVSATVPSLWLNFSKRRKKRRARSEIYIDILELTKERGPMTPFEIALYARLNHKRTKECITFLSLCNYLEQTSEIDGRASYVLTKEGLKFLERAEAFFSDHKLVTTEIPNHKGPQNSLR
jgi:predicted transcriptional regulator